jgi:hypothetical protein
MSKIWGDQILNQLLNFEMSFSPKPIYHVSTFNMLDYVSQEKTSFLRFTICLNLISPDVSLRL